MTVPASTPMVHAGQAARLWWLPAGGYGNGLDDDSWAPVLEISEQAVPLVLGMLRDYGVPAYAAPARSAAGMLRRRDRSGQAPGYRLWVGCSAYGRAEAALVAIMPSVARAVAGRAGKAWR